MFALAGFSNALAPQRHLAKTKPRVIPEDREGGGEVEGRGSEGSRSLIVCSLLIVLVLY